MRDPDDAPIAVVTGAGSGLGTAFVLDLLGRGYRCVAIDVNEAGLARLATQVHGRRAASRLRAECADVSVPGDLIGVAERVAPASVDLLINNAGVVFNSVPLWETPPEAAQWLFEVNVLGVINGAHAFVPAMIRAGRGLVVNVASLGGFHVRSVPGWRQGLYSASKAAIVALSEALEQELDGTGVRVSLAAPGAVRTAIADSSSAPFGVAATTEFGRSRIRSGAEPKPIAAEIINRSLAGEFLVFVGAEERSMISARHRRIEEAALTGTAPRR